MNINEMTLDEIQARILGGEAFTAEEYKAVIDRYRGDRRAAATTSAKARSKKAAATADFDLNASLDALFASKGV